MKTARGRVHGDGPSRRELKAFHRIGTFPEALVDELDTLARTCERNDLGGDNYTLPSSFDLTGTFNAVPASYRQVLLQESPEIYPPDETFYWKWDEQYKHIGAALQEHFTKVYRFRLSISKPHHFIPWHIDTDPSVSCRAQICLNPSGVFKFKTKQGEEHLYMERGGIYFINTGWSHSVEVGDEERRVAIFGFKFKDALQQDGLWI